MSTFETYSPPPGRVIVLPDTQNMTDRSPGMLHTLFSYILSRAPDLVLCVGDGTQNNSAAEWAILASEISRLTAAGIKWLFAMGNHDSDSSRSTLANDYLTAGNWTTLKDAGRVENGYALVTLGGRSWLVLVAEYAPRTATVAWLNSIAALYPSTPILFTTHAYLYRDGTRYDWAVKGAAQSYNPHSPGLDYTPLEGIFDGEELYQAFVLPNPNVRLVMCGHDFDRLQNGVARARLTSVRSGGSLCHQILQNYQEWEPCGRGFVREYYFDEGNHKISCSSYSAYTGLFLNSANDSFWLPMP